MYNEKVCLTWLTFVLFPLENWLSMIYCKYWYILLAVLNDIFVIKKTFSLQINRLALLFYLCKGIFLTNTSLCFFLELNAQHLQCISIKRKMQQYFFVAENENNLIFQRLFQKYFYYRNAIVMKTFKTWHT